MVLNATSYIRGLMRAVQLTRGYVAVVDDGHYERVMAAGPWSANTRHNVYAERVFTARGGKLQKQSMGNFILGITGAGKTQVNYKNRNALDNRMCNLRTCDLSQRSARARKYKKKTSSQFRGVSWDKRTRKWDARLRVRGKNMFLGLFTDELEAAAAWDAAARGNWGAFAFQNFPSDKESCVTVPISTEHVRRKRKHQQKVTSEYRGVSWREDIKKWRAALLFRGKLMHLGTFTDELNAALAYDQAAREHMGARAFTNFSPKKAPKEHREAPTSS
jgi:AP2-like factor, euAP2 lineage